MSKISIIGTHSSGKTTLAEAISEEFDIEYKRGDKTKDIFSKLGFNKEINELNNEEQWVLQQNILESLDSLQSQDSSYVTDGSSLTCIPYGLLFSNGGLKDQKGFTEFVKKARESARQTDLFIYLPPEIGLEDDGFRPKDNKVRMDIDNFIYGLLKEGDYNFKTVTGTVEQRLNTVAKLLKRRDKINPNFYLNNYVAFEGMPRSGKSTQLKTINGMKIFEKEIFVMKRLNNKYLNDFKRLRQENPYTNSNEVIELATESLRYDYQNNNVEERLKNGQIVISDRHKFSFITLFGNLGIPQSKIYSKTYDIPTPGQIYYFDIEPNTTVRRAINTHESALKRDIGFQRRVRDSYKQLGKEFDFTTIDAKQSKHNMTRDILIHLYQNVIEQKRGMIYEK